MGVTCLVVQWYGYAFGGEGVACFVYSGMGILGGGGGVQV